MFLFSCEITRELDLFYKFEFPEDINFETSNQIYNWVTENIIHKTDYPDDFCQLPYETMYLKTGDCEDRVVLMIAIYYVKFCEKSDLWLVDTNLDGEIDHAIWVTLDNFVTMNNIYNNNITVKHEFDYINDYIYLNR